MYKRQFNHRADIQVLEVVLDEALRVGRELDQSRAHDVITVSYTHLRAHETVLDLVCRLLLEKKKRLSTQHHITTIKQTNIQHSSTTPLN